MTQYNARTFVQSSYDDNDQLAKQKMIAFLQRGGHTIVTSAEDYNHDLVTTLGSETLWFELEFKTGYPFTTSATFPFDTVSFLGRKKRLHELQPFHYVVMCKETDYAVTCFSDDIFKDEYTHTLTINTRDRSGLDEMYRVPKDQCTFFNLQEWT